MHASIDQMLQLPKEVREKIHFIHYSDNWTTKFEEGAQFGDWAEEGVRYIFD